MWYVRDKILESCIKDGSTSALDLTQIHSRDVPTAVGTIPHGIRSGWFREMAWVDSQEPLGKRNASSIICPINEVGWALVLECQSSR